MSTPSSVTATVCSKWQAGLPLSVTTVHSSSSVSTVRSPMTTMGSTASVIPLRRTKSPFNCSGVTKLGTFGSSCIVRPMPWPTNSWTTPYPRLSTCRCISRAISLQRFPGLMREQASSSVSRVTFSSALRSWLISPTPSVMAVSAQYSPSFIARSRVTMSPSTSLRGPGMP